jgi:hypothetical protein
MKPNIAFLLPLYGDYFIQRFFDFGLLSLLAPGNLPALSKDYLCQFLFLTVEKDIALIEQQPLYEQLKAFCNIEFIDISDLIFKGEFGIHNISLALAYERGMRSRLDLLNTYFFFLVGDYVLANDSLEHTKRYFAEGYSGITTGSFRVTEETFSPQLKTFSLSAREMLQLAFQHIHPLTHAETVNQKALHSPNSNHLYWRVNQKIIVARFYTRHMLCIKPEIANYTLGGLCDYCFIQELCPSGKVAHIQDSDDVCVVEIAPSTHDQHLIKPGPLEIKQLAKELSKFLTLPQRQNARIPIIFHSEELQEWPHVTIQESAEFIDQVEKLFSSPPAPLRGHHFWVKTIEKHVFPKLITEADKGHYYNKKYATFAGIIGSPAFSPVFSNQLDDSPLLKFRSSKIKHPFLFDHSPQTFFWNPSWIDDFCFKRSLHYFLEPQASYILVLFAPHPTLIQWLEKHYPHTFTYQYADFMALRTPNDLGSIFHKKNGAFIYVTSYQKTLPEIIQICESRLTKKASLCIFSKESSLNYPYPIITPPSNRLKIFCQRFLKACMNTFFQHQKKIIQQSIALLGVVMISCLALFSNLFLLYKLKDNEKT